MKSGQNFLLSSLSAFIWGGGGWLWNKSLHTEGRSTRAAAAAIKMLLVVTFPNKSRHIAVQTNKRDRSLHSPSIQSKTKICQYILFYVTLAMTMTMIWLIQNRNHRVIPNKQEADQSNYMRERKQTNRAFNRSDLALPCMGGHPWQWQSSDWFKIGIIVFFQTNNIHLYQREKTGKQRLPISIS